MRHDNNQTAGTTNDDAEHEALARRNLLRLGGIAAAGAAAAAVASAVNADPAGATTGNMQYGAINVAGTDQTSLQAGTSGLATLQVIDNDPTGSSTGVAIHSNEGMGLMAVAEGIAHGAYIANTGSGTALEASDDVSGTGPAFAARVKNTSNASTAATVRTVGAGKALVVESSTGIALEVLTATGMAIRAENYGTNPAIAGVTWGTGPAIRATGKPVVAAAGVGAGHAAGLSVQGRAAFTRSGLLTIPAGATNALTPLVAGGLASTARVLATMQTVVAANVAVKSAVPILSTAVSANKGKIQIHLAAAAPAGGVTVAWFVFG